MIALLAAALAFPVAVGGVGAEDGPAAENEQIRVSGSDRAGVGGAVLGLAHYPLGTGNTFLNPEAGGAESVLHHDGGRVLGPDAYTTGYGAVDAYRIAARELSLDESVSVVSAATAPAGGGAHFIMSYWVKNLGAAPLTGVRFTQVVEPDPNGWENGSGNETARHDAATGIVWSTSDGGERALLGSVACAGAAGHGIVSNFDRERLLDGELNGATAFDGEAAYAQAMRIGSLLPGEVRQVDFAFRAAPEGGSVLDAAAFCPASPSPPPLPHLERLPDFRVVEVRVDRATTSVAGVVESDDPLGEWRATALVRNVGGLTECREYWISAAPREDGALERLRYVYVAGSGTHGEVCLAPGESAELVLEWTPVTIGSLEDARAQVGRIDVEARVLEGPYDRTPEDNVARWEGHVLVDA